MPEDLSFDILARDRASGPFRDVGRSASDAGDKMGLAARQARVLEDALNAQRRAADVSVGATLALARADKILADAEKDAARQASTVDRILAARGGDRSALASLVSQFGGGRGGRGGGSGSGIARAAASAAGGGGPLAALGGLPVVGGGLSAISGGGLAGGAAGVIAAIAALPFVAQAAAGVITTSLGGALTGVVAAGALMDKGVKGSFANVATNASNNAVKIGRVFVPIFNNIANTAVNVMAGLEPVFKGAAKIISGPFATFADTFERSFGSRAVQVSIKAVATSFAALLKAVTPQIPGDVNAIANGITAIAKSVAKNPKVFADFVFFLVHVAAGALQVIAALSNFATYLEKHFKPAIGDTTKYVTHVWDVMWADSIGAVIRFQQQDSKHMSELRHMIADTFDHIRHDVATIWDRAWADTIGKVETGAATVKRVLGDLIIRIHDDFAHAGTWLIDAGKATLEGFWNGLKSLAGSITGGGVLGWLGHWASSLIDGVKHILGIHSPSTVFYGIGQNVMQGLLHGMQSGQSRISRWVNADLAKTMASGLNPFGPPGSGPLVSYAKKLLGLYGWGNQFPAFNDVVMAESGWNVHATNPNSGAYGIPQALPPSKMASAGSDWQTSGYTQLRWMMAYIKSTYGNPDNAWAHEQQFHWYDQGGMLPRGASIAINNTPYPEQVIPHGAQAGGKPAVVLQVRSTGHDWDRFMINWFLNAVTVRGGGDVQAAFGHS